jgi:hypothetical protein
MSGRVCVVVRRPAERRLHVDGAAALAFLLP